MSAEAVRAGRQAGNLPTHVTSYLDRDETQQAVRDAVAKSRLVTLTGFGGMGKSRLSLAVAKEIQGNFPDGVWLVDLAPLEAKSALDDAVLTVLQGQDHSAGSARTQLRSYLADRELLLILDNCEHVLEQVVDLVADLLTGTPLLRILATSRESLNLGGERVVPVPPLSTPEPGQVRSPDDVVHFDSVKLLLDRVTAIHPGFMVHQGNYRAVAELCARLEGSPLTIELAAPRLRSLSIEQVIQRLDDQLHGLSSADRSIPVRQRTLVALVDWSYRLCGPEERLLWERASVFAGGFDLEAAEGVCAGDGLTRENILSVIDQLVSKSILNADTDSAVARFRFLETIRQYGHERLIDSGKMKEVAGHHRDYYLQLSQSVLDTWASEKQVDGISRLREERFNLTRALEWSFSTPGEQNTGLSMVIALRYHWAIGGFLREGRRWINQALRFVTTQSPDRGTALWVGAWIALVQGDRPGALGYLKEADKALEASNDPLLALHVLLMHGTAALFQSDFGDAIESLSTAVAGLRRYHEYGPVLVGEMQLIIALAHSGDRDRARAVADDVLKLSDELGEQWGRCQALWALGFDSWLSGDHAEATSFVQKALVLKPEFNRVGTALDLELLAWIATSRQQYERGLQLYGAAETMWNALGTSIGAFGLHFAVHSDWCKDELRGHLEPGIFDKLLAEGRTWDAARAVSFALSDEAPAQPKGPVLGSLTRRENEVAALIAEGLSTREIADSLVLSKRTVDGHIENIFSKLHFNSRAQLVSWLVKQQYGAKNG
ncbi:LuxR C-terminal-related transcriptional regulator [Arthrobacter sp. ZGTC412]|uniref:LuxR C-terminal-related transcriptional regulator n=1 Tax=Arthrobacter sp. ZGTC412 TaxID=2058900 RepID=UPI0027D35103|nr:LuxR C-terminal-related transcriptional regulator [Arthrobacter sp. ZGTC412]